MQTHTNHWCDMPRSRRGDKGFYEAVGRRIREARHGRMTQEALASLVSMTRTSIVNIEQGRQQLFLHTLVDIARALQTQPADLIPPSGQIEGNDLPAMLQGQPQDVQEWIKATVASVREREESDGGEKKART